MTYLNPDSKERWVIGVILVVLYYVGQVLPIRRTSLPIQEGMFSSPTQIANEQWTNMTSIHHSIVYASDKGFREVAANPSWLQARVGVHPGQVTN